MTRKELEKRGTKIFERDSFDGFIYLGTKFFSKSENLFIAQKKTAIK